VKSVETRQAIADGAVEIEMVVNIGKVLQEDWEYVKNEINAVTEACHKGKAIIKVIFENDYLPKINIKLNYVNMHRTKVILLKTSTGYGFVKQSDGSYKL
jgi:deoxyribose-phosphate aldolase